MKRVRARREEVPAKIKVRNHPHLHRDLSVCVYEHEIGSYSSLWMAPVRRDACLVGYRAYVQLQGRLAKWAGAGVSERRERASKNGAIRQSGC